MAGPFLIIDGYNLLHAAGMARADYGPGDLHRCRTRLLTYLREKLSPDEARRTTIVFDARDPPVGFPSRLTFAGLRVIFASPTGDADIVIEELIAEHSSPKRVRLISSDHRLQVAARRRRALFDDSETFVNELSRRQVTPRAARHVRDPIPDMKTMGLSEDETAHWLKTFGDVPEVEELSRKQLPEPIVPAKGAAPPASGKAAVQATGKAPDKATSAADDDMAHWLATFGEMPEIKQLSQQRQISQDDVNSWVKEIEEEEKGRGRRGGRQR